MTEIAAAAACVASLPTFPRFKLLELSDRAAITSITSRFDAYSDFNFVSLWCWDVESDTQVSALDDNLVLRIRDYLTGEPFLTVIGPHVTSAQLHELLRFACATNCKPRLELVPQCVARALTGALDLSVQDDPNHADYIVSAACNASLAGKRFSQRRRLARLFDHTHGSRAAWRTRPLCETLADFDLLSVFDDWLASTGPREDSDLERQAIARLEQLRYAAPLTVVAVEVDGKFRAFSVLEDVGRGTFLVHFAKADRRFKGLFTRLSQAEANYVVSQGGRFLNIEQDLGLAGLRISKQGERPITYLRKYIVEAR